VAQIAGEDVTLSTFKQNYFKLLSHFLLSPMEDITEVQEKTNFIWKKIGKSIIRSRNCVHVLLLTPDLEAWGTAGLQCMCYRFICAETKSYVQARYYSCKTLRSTEKHNKT